MKNNSDKFVMEITLELGRLGVHRAKQNTLKYGAKDPDMALRGLVIGAARHLARLQSDPARPHLLKHWPVLCRNIAREIVSGDLSAIGKPRTK